MRSFYVTALLLVVAAACFAQSKAPQRPKKPSAAAQAPAGEAASKQRFEADQKAIAELQQRDIAASMGIDVNELLSLWTDDGVLIPPGHAPVVGHDALKAFYEQYKKDFGNNDMLAYDEKWDEVQVAGDWAYQWGTITARIKPPVGNEETTSAVRAMRILKRESDGSWLIARAIYNIAPSAAAEPKPAPKPPEQPKPPQ